VRAAAPALATARPLPERACPAVQPPPVKGSESPLHHVTADHDHKTASSR
jgi:hypothetical protein